MKKSLSENVALVLCTVVALSASTGCGKRIDKSDLDIVGGRRVTADDSGPEKVSTVGLQGCTGTIIANDLILTAAHCYDNSIEGGFALFGIQFNGEDKKIIALDSAIINPAYTDPHNDIAMFKLVSDIPAGYKPVKLLPPNLALNPGDTVRQAGYGVNNTPDSFGTLRTVDSRFIGISDRSSLSVRNGQTAACSGDSGGPLYVQKNGEWYNAGVLSTGLVNSARRCIGGNEYASVTRNYSLIIDMAKKLTGRQNPLQSTATPARPEPGELNTDRPATPGSNSALAPAKFQVLSTMAQSGSDLSVQVKNTSARVVNNCEFTLSPIRNFFSFYAVTYDLTASVKQSAADQETTLHFKDPYTSNSNLGPIQSYTLKKTCAQ